MTVATAQIPAPVAVGTDARGDYAKIHQRFQPARLSNGLKEDGMADTDEALVLQSQNGDAKAFDALVRRHQQMIHALTFRMTGSLADADDLAQEAFIRAYEQIGSYGGRANFATWLYRIAVNACLNWRQRETRRTQVHADCAESLTTQMAEAGAPQPENESSRRLQAALLRLPAKQRAAIVLTVCDGLHHAEAAKALGCSEATVSWRVFAARRKLKRWLTAAGAER
jgi:RNA polymerase sigma-70 factor (ECF subfamily)